MEHRDPNYGREQDCRLYLFRTVLFNDEPLDIEYFQHQALKYGFNEKEYIEALKKVPLLSRESVEELSENLLKTYQLGNRNISLKLSLDTNIFFDMDIAVPLGMIINELVSNSLKHAFVGRDEGEIQIKLHREEIGSILKSTNKKSTGTSFTLTISDNGIGIPANLDIEALDSLGLQLVTSLVSQLDGDLEIKRNNGTEFIIRFTVIENKNHMSVPVSQRIDNNTFM